MNVIEDDDSPLGVIQHPHERISQHLEMLFVVFDIGDIWEAFVDCVSDRVMERCTLIDDVIIT